MYKNLIYDKVNVTTNNVSCQGAGSINDHLIYGHPLVYLKISNHENNIVCPYCSKQFILKK